MGDNAEFEKLSTLEARLAAALDRIAVGLGEAQPALLAEDPAFTSGAFEDAMIRAETAEARVAELEAYLAAQPGETEIEDTSAAVTALEAQVEHLSAQLAEREGRIAALNADLAAVAAQAADPARDDKIDRLTAQVADLEGRVARLRAERAEAIAERDEARDIAEELQAAGGMGPDDRAMALRAEVQELRTINERLTKNLARLRGENAGDPTVLNKALVVELDALKAARASEAAELERILADLDRAGAGESGHA
jgi:chromosome segregation ATPase